MSTYFPVVGNHFTENEPIQGETVILLRERNNLVDPNAICVVNMNGKKLGYIPRMQTEDASIFIGKNGKIFKYKNGYRLKLI